MLVVLSDKKYTVEDYKIFSKGQQKRYENY